MNLNFEQWFNTDVSQFVDTRKTQGVDLKYLSWAWAWAQVKQKDESASYNIIRFGERQLPYVYDEKTGYMVFTEVTILNQTLSMWLPVMDHNNRAMKSERYEVKTKKSTITVEPATMFDINKTIMRCLVKNIAMFGLGLRLYIGEDLPETSYIDDIPTVDINLTLSEEDINLLKNSVSFQDLVKNCSELTKKLGPNYKPLIIREYDKLRPNFESAK